MLMRYWSLNERRKTYIMVSDILIEIMAETDRTNGVACVSMEK